MPQIGFQGGILGQQIGFSIGILFEEIMAVAIAFTLLYAIIIPVSDAQREKRSIDWLAFPGATGESLNTLWLDDFNFFKGEQKTSCQGAIIPALTLNVSREVFYESTINSNTNCTSSILNKTHTDIFWDAVDTTIWYLDPLHWLSFQHPTERALQQTLCQDQDDSALQEEFARVTTNIINFLGPVGGFFVVMWNIFKSIVLLIKSCLLDGLRLMIGLAILGYITVKVIPIIQLIVGLVDMFFKLIGLY